MNSASPLPVSNFPAPRLNPFLRLLICVAGCIAILIIVVLIISAGVSVAASLRGLDATKQIDRFFSDNSLLVNLFVYPPTLLWLWFCRRFFDRRAFVALGLHARGFFGHFGGGLLCGFLACGLIFGVLVLTGNARVTGWSLAAQSGGIEKSFLLLLMWLGVMLCVGFMEEIAFRGYALHNLTAWLGTRAAVGIQAVAFALIHLGNLASQGKSTPDASLAAALAMPNITLIGIFFALTYLKTGSLWFAIAFHAAWNFCLGCVFSFPVSGIETFKLFDVQVGSNIFLTGGSFGPEASLLLTPILLAMNFVIARAPAHHQATFDLQSLLREFSINAQAHIPEPEIAESDEESANRFKTRMGKASRELDPDTIATLRALNEESKRRAQQQKESDFAIAAAPSSTPVVPRTPVTSTPIAPSTPRAPQIENAPKEPATQVQVAKNDQAPIEAPLPTQPIPAREVSTPIPTTSVSAPSTPQQESTPETRSTPAPKPAPRKEKPRW